MECKVARITAGTEWNDLEGDIATALYLLNCEYTPEAHRRAAQAYRAMVAYCQELEVWHCATADSMVAKDILNQPTSCPKCWHCGLDITDSSMDLAKHVQEGEPSVHFHQHCRWRYIHGIPRFTSEAK